MTTTLGEVGFAPDASNVYGALWTRDHAYVVWHMPWLLSTAQIADFVRVRLNNRSTAATVDPDGGTLGTSGANFVCDRITSAGAVVFKNAGASELPFMDGAAFVVLALWTHWKRTKDTALYLEMKSAVDACLAALPRSVNGCVWSDPAVPSVDYGFTDGVKKTGDVAYGTALQAWSYKMMSEIAGENGVGTYSTARVLAQDGLATLRKTSGWYRGSSGNNAAVDDVWATSLIAAEGLCTPAEAQVSALALMNAYLAGTITSRGWVRHLPAGQFWTNTVVAQGTYQNGAYWLTPLWDCYRAVMLVNPDVALAWASQAIAEVQRQYAAQGTVGVRTAPYEWFNETAISTPKGYSASAAILARFTTKPPRAYSVGSAIIDDFTTGTTGWTLTGFSWDATNKRLVSAGAVDGETAIRTGSAAVADVSVTADCTFSTQAQTFFGIILRWVDNNNYIFASVGGTNNQELDIYDKIGGTITARPLVTITPLVAGVTYSVRAWVVGTQVSLQVGSGVINTVTSSITAPGRVGFRHGRVGAGVTTYDNAVIAPATTGQLVPADLIVAHGGAIVPPGASLSAPLVGQYRFLDAAGRPVALGESYGGAVSITAALD